MTSSPTSTADPFVLPYEGVLPSFGVAPHVFGGRASVLGRAQIGARVWLGPRAVVRADGHFVRIGDDFHLGEAGTVHIAHEVYPAIVGDRVSAGRNAVIHACTVGDDCVFEDNVVILDGSTIGTGVLIETGSTVFPRSELAPGRLYAGAPAKPVRDISINELGERRARLDRRIADGFADRLAACRVSEGDVFVARTAWLSGVVGLGSASSVFFSCDLDAGGRTITIGDNVNVQDNSVIACAASDVVIGRDTTIGHNVTMTDCSVGERALIGIGCVVAPGTVVGDDALLAAGARTNLGQQLESGWLWGGRPARKLSRLDDDKTAMMASIVSTYCDYGRLYAAAQRELRETYGGGRDGLRNVRTSRPVW